MIAAAAFGIIAYLVGNAIYSRTICGINLCPAPANLPSSAAP